MLQCERARLAFTRLITHKYISGNFWATVLTFNIKKINYMELDQNVVTTNNLQNTKNSFGNCFGMTVSWVKSSIRYDGVTKSWQIDNGVILQARLNNQWKNEQVKGAVRRAGLNIVNTSKYYSSFGNQDGHVVVIIDNPAHAMGARVEGDTYQFFDPNSGLHIADNFDDLYKSVWAYLHKTYPGWKLRELFVVK